jgi:hypothetical protein
MCALGVEVLVFDTGCCILPVNLLVGVPGWGMGRGGDGAARAPTHEGVEGMQPQPVNGLNDAGWQKPCQAANFGHGLQALVCGCGCVRACMCPRRNHQQFVAHYMSSPAGLLMFAVLQHLCDPTHVCCCLRASHCCLFGLCNPLKPNIGVCVDGTRGACCYKPNLVAPTNVSD